MTPEATATLTKISEAENFRTWHFGVIAEVERLSRSMPAELAATMIENPPWDGEPDKVQWIDPTTDLDCLIVRNHMGVLCGYVGVPPEHPLHGHYYNTCMQGCGQTWCEHSPESVLRVHGGITFSEFCNPGEKDNSICHVPAPGRPDRVYWFGFDTGHAWDLNPGMVSFFHDDDQVYRDLAYVVSQIEDLAKQLVAIKEPA